jgi:hypothetical protein
MFRSIYSIFTPSYNQEIVPHKFSAVQKTIAGNHKIGFDDICGIITRGKLSEFKIVLINTLPIEEQDVLISNTIPYQTEESIINQILLEYSMSKYTIIVYGRNNADDTVDKKFKQLQKLGFVNIFIYYGGMFEWMLLQDIYGTSYFPTTNTKINDPLKFMAKRKLI